MVAPMDHVSGDFYADMHSHSRHSFDGKDSVLGMLVAAEERGLSELCITDHFDITMPPVKLPDAEAYLTELREVRGSYTGRTKLLLGMELGEGLQNPALAEALAARPEWDYVIGSLHNLMGERDFYHLAYPDLDTCYALLDRYWLELLDFIRWGHFDVLGHLTYPLRYMCGRGKHQSEGRGGHSIHLLDRYETPLRTLFSLMVDQGIGLEINVSGLYREGYPPWSMPTMDIAALYREAGGDIVTLGSDAHEAAHVGLGIQEGLKLLRGAGFGYVAAFRERTLRYEKI